MNARDTSGAAFPHPAGTDGYDEAFYAQTGLTKREYAAIHLLAGLVASPTSDDMTLDDLALHAVAQTDALLAALAEDAG